MGKLIDLHGFSLLELLLALFMVSIVLLPLIGAELQMEQQGDRADLQTRAHLVARQKLEELMATPYDELGAGNDTLDLQGTRSLTRTWSVTRDDPRPEMTTIVVVVRETGRGGLADVPAVRYSAAVREY